MRLLTFYSLAAWPALTRSVFSQIGLYTPLVSALISDLRKRFEREPINTAVAIESPAELQCLAPSGSPAPQVGSFIRLLLHCIHIIA